MYRRQAILFTALLLTACACATWFLPADTRPAGYSPSSSKVRPQQQGNVAQGDASAFRSAYSAVPFPIVPALPAPEAQGIEKRTRYVGRWGAGVGEFGLLTVEADPEAVRGVAISEADRRAYVNDTVNRRIVVIALDSGRAVRSFPTPEGAIVNDVVLSGGASLTLVDRAQRTMYRTDLEGVIQSTSPFPEVQLDLFDPLLVGEGDDRLIAGRMDTGDIVGIDASGTRQLGSFQLAVRGRDVAVTWRGGSSCVATLPYDLAEVTAYTATADGRSIAVAVRVRDAPHESALVVWRDGTPRFVFTESDELQATPYPLALTSESLVQLHVTRAGLEVLEFPDL